MTHICPHCGYDVEPAAPVVTNRVAFIPEEGRVIVDGERLITRPMAVEVIGALMRARGSVLPQSAIAERLGYEGDDAHYAHVVVCHARKALGRYGLADRIETVRGRGYRWVEPKMATA